MTLEDLTMDELQEMKKACEKLLHMYENPHQSYTDCPLCEVYLTPVGSDDECKKCPHHTIDQVPLMGKVTQGISSSGRPCYRNENVAHHGGAEYYESLRTFTDEELKEEFSQEFAIELKRIRLKHIKRVESWIRQIETEIAKVVG